MSVPSSNRVAGVKLSGAGIASEPRSGTHTGSAKGSLVDTAAPAPGKTTRGQFTDIAHLGIELRQGRASIRAQLRAGADVCAILTDPPQCIRDLNLYEVLGMARGMGRQRLEDLGRLALRDDVNLMIRVDRISDWTIAWLRRHIAPGVGASGMRSLWP